MPIKLRNGIRRGGIPTNEHIHFGLALKTFKEARSRLRTIYKLSVDFA
jgi:hypothetical protein